MNSVMFISIIVLFLLFTTFQVSASYYDYCNEVVIETGENMYYDCGDNAIYLMENNKEKSSFIYAGKNLGIKNKLLYVGKVSGLDTFYASAFNFYAVVYDDRPFLGHGDDMWASVVINNVSVYDGSFENSLLFDKSSKIKKPLYNEIGTYIIKQYINGNISNAIRVIIPSKDDFGISVVSYKYGSIDMDGKSAISKYEDIKFAISGGKYGYPKSVNVRVNDCKINLDFSESLVIRNDLFEECLKYNENNKVELVLYNGLNKKKIFNYSFVINSEDVSIKLESSVSKLSTSSRRIVIKAKAGVGKELESDSNLYYWSTNADDKLTYEDFLSNYEKSENKGIYTLNKGVILRNSEGTYYLYALAKDADSYAVVRSDPYILNDGHSVNKVIYKDFILVIALCLTALVPVIIYLFVRGKDTF